MAVRIRTGFHAAGKPRGMAELATVAAALGWKLAIETIRRLRVAGYDIDIGRPYYDVVCEMMVFLAAAADRIAHRELEAAQRDEFTPALVTRMAELVDENRGMLIEDVEPGGCRHGFIDLFNQRSAEYAGFGYADGPDFGFRRLLAACLRDALPDKDRLWVIDQVMEIEAPEGIAALEKTLTGLFHPEAQSRRRRGGVSGE